MKDALTILKDAYALLQDRSKWTTKTAARNARNEIAMPTHPEAERFCAAGAIFAVSDLETVFDFSSSSRPAVTQAFRALALALGDENTDVIANTNDGPNGYELIMNGYRNAIADLTPIESRPEKPVLVEEKVIVVV